MSRSALSLLFITTTSSTAAGVLRHATKLYLDGLFPAARLGDAGEQSSKAAHHLRGQIALISVYHILLGHNESD